MGPYELLCRVVVAFDALGISYLVTGAMASIAWGEPRLTADIDIVAYIKMEQIPGLAAYFPGSEFYFDEAVAREAVERKGQFNIIHAGSGLKVDIYIEQDTPFDRSRFSRGRKVRLGRDCEANFASPEDVIIKKMEYYRQGASEKHLRDIAGILAVGRQEIDGAYITRWAARLGLVDIWNAVVERLGAKE